MDLRPAGRAGDGGAVAGRDGGPRRRSDAQPGAGGAIVFPLRIGAIDLGSNAIRYLALEVDDQGRQSVLASDRVAVRLGHGVFVSGRLAREAMDAAVAALTAIRQRFDELGVSRLRAVATSAVREASNGEGFITRAHREAGIALEVITGSEEARLVFLAVAARMPLGDGAWVAADLGGGSVEVSLLDANGIIWSESHTMGSVRLLEELSGAGDDPGRFRRLLGEYIDTLRIPAAARARTLAGFIATGGNIEAIARLVGIDGSPSGVGVLPLATLRGVIDTLSRLSYRQRVAELGLREDRADVILPAAMVYERLCALAGAELLHVPFVGVREGVALDLVEELTHGRAYEDRHEREVLAGALAVGRRYLFDEAHGTHVSRLATSLFDQLRDAHSLGASERRLLSVAALLHDIGSFISYKRHHKHSFYLIANAELPALTPREILLAATVARYHRKAEPAADHEPYNELTRSEQASVRRLAALLRLADALDRDHRQRVQRVTVARSGKELVLQLDGAGDLLLERWSLQRRANLFESEFGVRVRLADEGRRP
jgi:exopolyphosphatase / guanosine-5'-triphosphate,3'-diphosphate pyrophosphatase